MSRLNMDKRHDGSRTFLVMPPGRGIISRARARHDRREKVLLGRPEGLLEAAAGAKGPDLDAADDVGGKGVAGEVFYEGAGAGVVGADDGAEEGFNLVEAAFEGKDVSNVVGFC